MSTDGKILVVCGECQARIRVSPNLAGKTGSCPKCQNILNVPHSDVESSKIVEIIGETDTTSRPPLINFQPLINEFEAEAERQLQKQREQQALESKRLEKEKEEERLLAEKKQQDSEKERQILESKNYLAFLRESSVLMVIWHFCTWGLAFVALQILFFSTNRTALDTIIAAVFNFALFWFWIKSYGRLAEKVQMCLTYNPDYKYYHGEEEAQKN
jgi:hypothetical protein